MSMSTVQIFSILVRSSGHRVSTLSRNIVSIGITPTQISSNEPHQRARNHFLQTYRSLVRNAFKNEYKRSYEDLNHRHVHKGDTMFETREWYKSLRERLRAADKNDMFSDPALSVLLFRVELGLHLLEVLGCANDAIESAWVWFTNIDIVDRKRRNLSDKQKLALANACVLLRFGKYDWIAALKTYAALSAEWRCYLVDPNDLTLPVTREPNGPKYVTGRFSTYSECLSQEIMPYSARYRSVADPGTVVFRTHYPRPRVLTASLNETAIKTASAANSSLVGFSQGPQQKMRVSITYENLLSLAEE